MTCIIWVALSALGFLPLCQGLAWDAGRGGVFGGDRQLLLRPGSLPGVELLPQLL